MERSSPLLRAETTRKKMLTVPGTWPAGFSCALFCYVKMDRRDKEVTEEGKSGQTYQWYVGRSTRASLEAGEPLSPVWSSAAGME
jgi:hypothetical protein